MVGEFSIFFCIAEDFGLGVISPVFVRNRLFFALTGGTKMSRFRCLNFPLGRITLRENTATLAAGREPIGSSFARRYRTARAVPLLCAGKMLRIAVPARS